MLSNFLGYHRLWIWKTSHFSSHNLWLQKCSYSTYLGNKWIFILRDKINTAIFLSVEHFLPSVSCLHNFLGGRKMKTSCWENQGRVVLFISEMACAWCSCTHRPRTMNCWAFCQQTQGCCTQESASWGLPVPGQCSTKPGISQVCWLGWAWCWGLQHDFSQPWAQWSNLCLQKAGVVSPASPGLHPKSG